MVYRALLEEIIDVALPPILLGILVLGVHSVVKSYSRGWKCWIAILTLCRMYEMVLQRQSAFHPRNYIVLIRKVSTNLLEIVDMVMPMVLLVIIMIASHFLYFAPIPWPLIRWAAALVLCIIFIVRAHIQNRWPKQEDGDAGGQTLLAMII
ncbi:uncharacterized protein LOC115989257 [Quercus lobata]|uniref:uncharacterized protein LOC115989257 n=1 Tax=Quercus lobata TaxID=97700 RepID=UPI001248FFC4|nr:uncharacterized protein LOC115989257 [Quercus lobata]